jgi:predicted DCC family thiol-disulfide oxidoreductase YuxK
MVILFDGVCNMCNGFVKFVIKQDKKNVFQFASLQSKYGKGLLEQYHFNSVEYDTVILLDGKTIYTRSDATLRILNTLGGFWKVSAAFRIIPGFIRNPIYDLLARNRYKLFGKRETCMVPTPELKAKFLDETDFTP